MAIFLEKKISKNDLLYVICHSTSFVLKLGYFLESTRQWSSNVWIPPAKSRMVPSLHVTNSVTFKWSPHSWASTKFPCIVLKSKALKISNQPWNRYTHMISLSHQDGIGLSVEDKIWKEKREFSVKFNIGHYEIKLRFRNEETLLPDNRNQDFQRIASTSSWNRLERRSDYWRRKATTKFWKSICKMLNSSCGVTSRNNRFQMNWKYYSPVQNRVCWASSAPS